MHDSIEREPSTSGRRLPGPGELLLETNNRAAARFELSQRFRAPGCRYRVSTRERVSTFTPSPRTRFKQRVKRSR